MTDTYLFLVSPRRSSSGPCSDAADSEFPGQHFQGDLLLLALGASQRDLFEEDWLDVMVRVYWLKARFLVLQVRSPLCLIDFCLSGISPLSQREPIVCLSCLCQGDMEVALDSYDVCTGLLQSKPKTPEGKHYTIHLPNLRVDAAISVEEVSEVTFPIYYYNTLLKMILVCLHFASPLKYHEGVCDVLRPLE